VTLFFFLSGYLITSLLRAEFNLSGTVSLRGFYMRRVLRIMPPLYVTLVLLTIGEAFGIFGERPSADAIIADYLLLSNYSHLWGAEIGLPVPLWSLAVEEHFYLLFPLLFVTVLAKRASLEAFGICLALCLTALALRVVTTEDPYSLFRNYYWSHTRIDSILFGCCLALWQNPLMDNGAWKPRDWHFGLALAAILLTFVIRDEVFRQTIRYTIQGGALFVIFSYALSRKSGIVFRVLALKSLAYVALLSYTLYLCHVAIFKALEVKLHLAGPVLGVTGTVLAFAYAAAMRALVEKPVATARKRLKVRQTDLIEMPPRVDPQPSPAQP
jgi:peptidoglycan/LPS O-acetylase OafA/YrhL